jgi:hypothetical protein
LAPFTNLSNLIGEFKAIDVPTLYVELANVGFLRWNAEYKNLRDARPNVFGGVLVNIIQEYRIYQKIGDEPYLLTLKLPFIVHMPDFVSPTQYSRTNYLLTMVSEAVTSPAEVSTDPAYDNAEPLGAPPTSCAPLEPGLPPIYLPGAPGEPSICASD